jgi:hypothetical protein
MAFSFLRRLIETAPSPGAWHCAAGWVAGQILQARARNTGVERRIRPIERPKSKEGVAPSS